MLIQKTAFTSLLAGALMLPAGVTLAALPGALDPTFGSGGIVTEDFPDAPVNSVVSSVIQQADGKLVVAGYRRDNALDPAMAVARFNSDGTLDTAFSSDGRQVVSFANGRSSAQAVAVTSGNKLMLAGSASNGLNLDFALVRLSASGSVDGSFGSSGTVTTGIGVGNDGAMALRVHSDGRMKAAGYSAGAGSNGEDFALVGYKANGELDTSFGTGGKVVTHLGGNDVANTMLLQSDGKLLLAGSSEGLVSGLQSFALARYNSNGALDVSFSQDGRLTTSFGNSTSSEARGILRQGGGRLVVVGCSKETSTSDRDVALARYFSDGTLDTSFGNSGLRTTDVNGGDDCAYDIVELFDGKLLVIGTAQSASTGNDFLLLRYTANGTLDTTFGSGGKVTTPVSGGNVPDYAFAAVEQADEQVVAVGYSGNQMALVRYLFDDDDADGVTDALDNCQYVKNADQANHDTDSLGDACDDDDDNDGVPDDEDAFPLDPTESVDTDGDGIGNNADTDDDNDGVPDIDDPFPLDAYLLNRITGDSKGDQAGYSVAMVGDVDGDGHADVLVGAPKNDVVLPGKSKPAADVGTAWLSSGQTLAILATFDGAAKGDNFGQTVAALGDIDNDGTPDFAIGAPLADQLDPLTGKVLVKDRGAVTVYSGASRTALYTLAGDAAGDGFGIAVTAVADVDSDSHGDLLVGAWKADGTDPLTLKPLKDAGAAYLYSGQAGSRLATFTGAAKGDYFGFSVAAGSDLDHDAVPELVIGAYQHDPLDPVTSKPRSNAGSVYLYAATAPYEPVMTLAGAVKGDQAGFALAVVDSGLDAFADLLVGVPKAEVVTDKNYKDAGRVLLFADDSGTALYSVQAGVPQAGALFGYAVAAAGDVNAAGAAEFVVGAPKTDVVNLAGAKLKNAGQISVYSADAGAAVFAIDGDTKAGQYGFAVAGGGDHNADGYDDVMAGTPFAAFEGLAKTGVAKVISGKEASAPVVP